jgi:type IV pilus assembly protein PilE
MIKNNKGFTLIELMIVIAIIGILAAVGYPAYTSSVKKGNRADAISALLYEAGRMEEFYMNSDTYTGAAVSTASSPEGLYTIAVTIPGGGLSYTLTATPVGSDPECTTLTLDSLGQKGSTGTASSCW